MIVIGIYHRHFNYISIDKLTTHESFASVSNFSVNNFTYQSNCYSRSIHCQAIILFIVDTYLGLDSSHNLCENFLSCERIHMFQQENFLLNPPWGCKE